MSGISPKDELKAILLDAIESIQANLAKQEIGDSYAPRPTGIPQSPTPEFQAVIDQQNKSIADSATNKGLDIFYILAPDDKKTMLPMLVEVGQVAGRDIEKELAERELHSRTAREKQGVQFLPDYYKQESKNEGRSQDEPTKVFLPDFYIESRNDGQEISADDIEKKQPEPDLEPDKED